MTHNRELVDQLNDMHDNEVLQVHDLTHKIMLARYGTKNRRIVQDIEDDRIRNDPWRGL